MMARGRPVAMVRGLALAAVVLVVTSAALLPMFGLYVPAGVGLLGLVFYLEVAGGGWITIQQSIVESGLKLAILAAARLCPQRAGQPTIAGSRNSGC